MIKNLKIVRAFKACGWRRLLTVSTIAYERMNRMTEVSSEPTGLSEIQAYMLPSKAGIWDDPDRRYYSNGNAKQEREKGENLVKKGKAYNLINYDCVCKFSNAKNPKACPNETRDQVTKCRYNLSEEKNPQIKLYYVPGALFIEEQSSVIHYKSCAIHPQCDLDKLEWKANANIKGASRSQRSNVHQDTCLEFQTKVCCKDFKAHTLNLQDEAYMSEEPICSFVHFTALEYGFNGKVPDIGPAKNAKNHPAINADGFMQTCISIQNMVTGTLVRNHFARHQNDYATDRDKQIFPDALLPLCVFFYFAESYIVMEKNPQQIDLLRTAQSHPEKENKRSRGSASQGCMDLYESHNTGIQQGPLHNSAEVIGRLGKSGNCATHAHTVANLNIQIMSILKNTLVEDNAANLLAKRLFTCSTGTHPTKLKTVTYVYIRDRKIHKTYRPNAATNALPTPPRRPGHPDSCNTAPRPVPTPNTVPPRATHETQRLTRSLSVLQPSPASSGTGSGPVERRRPLVGIQFLPGDDTGRGRAGGAGAGQPRAASRGPRSPEPGVWLISSPAGPGSCEHVGASSRGPGLRAAAASSVLYLLRLPESEQGSGALQTRTLTHAHTRASSGQSQPCHRRARTPGERGRRLKEKKERGGGKSQAAAAAAAGAEATTSTGKAGSGSGGAHQDQRQHLHPSSWELGRAVPGEQTTRRRAESRSERGRAGAVQPACGGRSRGPSRGQNEPRAGELRERRKPRRGLAPEKGVAGGKTRIWNWSPSKGQIYIGGLVTLGQIDPILNYQILQLKRTELHKCPDINGTGYGKISLNIEGTPATFMGNPYGLVPMESHELEENRIHFKTQQFNPPYNHQQIPLGSGGLDSLPLYLMALIFKRLVKNTEHGKELLLKALPLLQIRYKLMALNYITKVHVLTQCKIGKAYLFWLSDSVAFGINHYVGETKEKIGRAGLEVQIAKGFTGPSSQYGRVDCNKAKEIERLKKWSAKRLTLGLAAKPGRLQLVKKEGLTKGYQHGSTRKIQQGIIMSRLKSCAFIKSITMNGNTEQIFENFSIPRGKSVMSTQIPIPLTFQLLLRHGCTKEENQSTKMLYMLEIGILKKKTNNKIKEERHSQISQIPQKFKKIHDKAELMAGSGLEETLGTSAADFVALHKQIKSETGKHGSWGTGLQRTNESYLRPRLATVQTRFRFKQQGSPRLGPPPSPKIMFFKITTMKLQEFNKILTLELPGAGPDDYVLIDLPKEKGKAKFLKLKSFNKITFYLKNNVDDALYIGKVKKLALLAKKNAFTEHRVYEKKQIDNDIFDCSNVILGSWVGNFLYQRDKLWSQNAFWVIVSCQCCKEFMVFLGLVPPSRRASEAYPKMQLEPGTYTLHIPPKSLNVPRLRNSQGYFRLKNYCRSAQEVNAETTSAHKSLLSHEVNQKKPGEQADYLYIVYSMGYKVNILKILDIIAEWELNKHYVNQEGHAGVRPNANTG
ncbi:hypothetical protein EI555_019816 [Monodon monoceros]|uniref:Uncharacterized protein n=1 Tax=Monodon monoceros TaxID=40151 RepID=A0A4U1FKI5_MONMO|nr:hypothetical protein EI555_019816 [Monodon monoceros]